MRKYFVHTVLGILLLLVVGMQLLAAPTVASPIVVSVKIMPKTLNLMGNGTITAFIEFNNSLYNVSDIDCESIKLRVKGAGDYVVPIRCIIADGKLVAKFYSLNVAVHILLKLNHMQIPPPLPRAKISVTLVVEGMVEVVEDTVTEKRFEGEDQIRIMLP